jgi:RimJ/RimL family protein N-acetyltransferase
MTILAATIVTDRLVLVPLEVAHADEMSVVLGDPSLYSFTGGEPPSARVLRSRYARMLAGSSEPTVSWCNWVIRLDCELVGFVQATIESGDRAEIAWVVGVPWQRRGIAREAAGGLVGWLAGQVAEIIAHVHPDHAASNGVARAVGMTPTDETHDGEVLWRRAGSGDRARSAG